MPQNVSTVKIARLFIAFWSVGFVRAQDLAPAVVGDMLIEYEPPTSGPISPRIVEMLSSDGLSYILGGSFPGNALPYFWTKTSATTGTLEFTRGSARFQTLLTFNSARTGSYRTGLNTGSFKLTAYETTANAPLRNVSARVVGAGQQAAIVGFVIAGNARRKVLVRAAGPSLATLGVARPATELVLSVWNGNSLLAENRGWGGDTALADVFASVGAFPFPRLSRDCALLLSVAPGNYTARVTAQTGEEALVEVYYVD